MGGSSSKGTTTTENKIPQELSGLTTQTAARIGEIQKQPGFDPSIYGSTMPVQVPGLSANQRLAGMWAQNVGNQPGGESAAYNTLGNAGGYAGQSGQATGGTLATDPSMAAAYNAFRTTTMPDIQRQYGLMGLGNSSLMGDAIARGAASTLYPATEAALQREQSAKEAQIGRQTGTALSAAGQYAGLGQNEVARRLAEVQALSGTGATERQAESERAQAEYADMLRRQALSESMTTGILGALPSSLGSQVVAKTSGGSK